MLLLIKSFSEMIELKFAINLKRAKYDKFACKQAKERAEIINK